MISNEPSYEPLQPTDFPNVRFWSRRQWSCPSNVKGHAHFNYIEMEDGGVVDETRVHEMREAAWTIWKASKKEGIFPPTWRSASVEVRSKYYREMRHKFPEFRLCDADWKADQLATDSYYSWRNYHATKGKGRQGTNISSMEPVAKRMKTGIELEQVSSIGEPFTTSLDSYFAPNFEPSQALQVGIIESGPSAFQVGSQVRFICILWWKYFNSFSIGWRRHFLSAG